MIDAIVGGLHLIGRVRHQLPLRARWQWNTKTCLQSLQPVRSIVRQHHERYDGSGYPDGLRGDEISLSAQIVGLLDIFEALTSPRPYQKTRSHAEALELMRGQTERGWHRRDLVDALAGLIRAA
jgi:putative two-component system response regulator